MFCQRCRVLQDTEGADYFTLLGLACTYDVDLEDLHERFVERSRQVHPDYYSGQDGDVQTLAMRNSARLNQAYRTLRDPLDRAEYLLGLAGGPSTASSKSVPPEFLAGIMELREDVDQAKRQSDTETLDRIRNQLLADRCEIHQAIVLLARQAAQPEVAPGILADLRMQLNTISYVNTLIRQL
jgi:molecular chaperone HscB